MPSNAKRQSKTFAVDAFASAGDPSATTVICFPTDPSEMRMARIHRHVTPASYARLSWLFHNNPEWTVTPAIAHLGWAAIYKASA